MYLGTESHLFLKKMLSEQRPTNQIKRTKAQLLWLGNISCSKYPLSIRVNQPLKVNCSAFWGHPIKVSSPWKYAAVYLSGEKKRMHEENNTVSYITKWCLLFLFHVSNERIAWESKLYCYCSSLCGKTGSSRSAAQQWDCSSWGLCSPQTHQQLINPISYIIWIWNSRCRRCSWMKINQEKILETGTFISNRSSFYFLIFAVQLCSYCERKGIFEKCQIATDILCGHSKQRSICFCICIDCCLVNIVHRNRVVWTHEQIVAKNPKGIHSFTNLLASKNNSFLKST